VDADVGWVRNARGGLGVPDVEAVRRMVRAGGEPPIGPGVRRHAEVDRHLIRDDDAVCDQVLPDGMPDGTYSRRGVVERLHRSVQARVGHDGIDLVEAQRRMASNISRGLSADCSAGVDTGSSGELEEFVVLGRDVLPGERTDEDQVFDAEVVVCDLFVGTVLSGQAGELADAFGPGERRRPLLARSHSCPSLRTQFVVADG
jgi:hypothetical protein